MAERVRWATRVDSGSGYTAGRRYKIIGEGQWADYKGADGHLIDDNGRLRPCFSADFTDFADELDEDAAKESIREANAVPEREQIAETLEATPEKLPSGNVGIDATLAERGSRYGQFKDQAVYADKINDALVSSPNWTTMAPDQREALRIIANKIGRILNGDPNYADSWHDIAGYAKLVDDRLNGVAK